MLRNISLCVCNVRKRNDYGTNLVIGSVSRFLYDRGGIRTMNSCYIAGIDQGTSSTRVSLYDKKGVKRCSHQVKISPITPRPGWVEHDPQKILDSCRECLIQVANIASDMKIDLGLIKAIGIANQRETVLIWDKNTGKPLYNAIVWSDIRNSSIVLRMKSIYGGSSYFKSKTGLSINTYSSVFKAIWLIENVPEVKLAIEEKRALFGTIETWLIWNFTGGVDNGVHVTDVSNASRTMLLNLNSMTWDESICKELNFPMDILPQIKTNSEFFGKMNFGIKFWESVLITGSLGDQSAAMVGLKCFEHGATKVTCGTGCFIMCNTGEKPLFSKNLITTVFYQFGSNEPVHYALEGSIASAGGGVQWLHSNMGLLDNPDKIDELAGSVPDSGGVFFVPAFTGLLAPWWDSTARGLIIGLGTNTNKAHVARAIIDAIAFECAEIIPEMEASLGFKIDFFTLDGGMSKSELLLQSLCNYLEKEVRRPTDVEATSLGAAYTAGKTIGFFDDENGVFMDRDSDVFKCETRLKDREKLMKKWRKAVSRSLMWEDSNEED